MRFLVIFISLLVSSLGFAKISNFTVQINKVSVNGSLDMQPRRLNVKENQSVIISRSFDAAGTNTIVEMTVKNDDSKMKDGILVSLSVIEEKDGVKKVVGTPQLLVKSGSEAQMIQGKEGETPFIEASLTSTRIQ